MDEKKWQEEIECYNTTRVMLHLLLLLLLAIVHCRINLARWQKICLRH
jgi:hypothetical protein